MGRGTEQDAADDVEAIAASGERTARLAAIFLRQAPHRGRGDVGRVGDDEIVASSAQRAEQIGPEQPDTVAQPVAADVEARDRQRRGRDVGGVDPRAGKAQREENGQVARPGAEVEGARYRPGVRHPGCKVYTQQPCDMGTRHHDALVHVESEIAEPGLARQVGSRLACADAAFDEGQRPPRLARRNRPASGRGPLAECVKHKPRGLVTCAGRPVAE